MSAASKPHRPERPVGLNPDFRRKVLDRHELRRLADQTMLDAERRGRELLDRARLDVEAMLAAARREALQLLAMLPDFATVEATPDAYGAIRGVADRYGVPMAAIVGRRLNVRNPKIRAVRDEAVIAVAQACPDLAYAEIGELFAGMSHDAVGRVLRKWYAERGGRQVSPIRKEVVIGEPEPTQEGLL